MSEIKNDRSDHYGAKHSKYNRITTLGFTGLTGVCSRLLLIQVADISTLTEVDCV